MYKQSTLDGDAMAQCALAPRPMGPEFSKDQVEKADQLEVWCTTALEPGPDMTEFRLKRHGKTVAIVVVPGY